MAHSDAGHAGMDHGGSGMCSMNMLFTWAYKDTCVVFKWWHIKTIPHMFFSCFAVGALAYLYEYLKYCCHKSLVHHGGAVSANTGLTSGMGRSLRLRRSVWYGLQVGFSFMLMLVYMTYNGWLMISVVLGAIYGHYVWGALLEESPRTSLACH
ncbi:LAMI_0F15060g1_1 [Lachancea mirantina]|uniref:Copper transport protein n=1 Tax=Lachancea mirantina TaxID=1230905 RepID=A0A1G4K4H0_9SACH|nr:LAMI_0F15060g1_1 [Lachancea mirantina]